jgi:hypothetical protein
LNGPGGPGGSGDCKSARHLLFSAEGARGAGIKTRIGNHTFRTAGITAYLENKDAAQPIANRESPRAAKLCGRRQDEFPLDEVERIAI